MLKVNVVTLITSTQFHIDPSEKMCQSDFLRGWVLKFISKKGPLSGTFNLFYQCSSTLLISKLYNWPGLMGLTDFYFDFSLVQ